MKAITVIMVVVLIVLAVMVGFALEVHQGVRPLGTFGQPHLRPCMGERLPAHAKHQEGGDEPSIHGAPV